MLPNPRHPLAPEAVVPDPPPDPPPDTPPLATLLSRLLHGAGAQAARAVDGRSEAALAVVGLADGDDVSALLQVTRAATTAGKSRGEWVEDVVVTLGRTVHVLRECGGAILHARLDPARGDTTAVRRALAAAEMQTAVLVALRAAPRGRAWTGLAEGPTHPAIRPPLAPPPGPPPSQQSGPPSGQQSGLPLGPAPVSQSGPPSGPRSGLPLGPPSGPQSGPAPVLQPGPPSGPQPGPPRPAPRPTPTPRPTPRPAQRAAVPLPAPPLPAPRPPVPARPLARLPEPPPPLPPLPLPVGGQGARGENPALVQVDGAAPASRSGALAVLALPPVTTPPMMTLPRRRPTAPSPFPRPPRGGGNTPEVLRQAWASDVATMQRLLGALQRMA